MIETLTEMIKHEASKRQLDVLNRVMCPNRCPCGFDVDVYRDRYRWHSICKIEYQRAATRYMHYQNSITGDRLDMWTGYLQDSQVEIYNIKQPCKLCWLKYNPRNRQRETLPAIRSDADLLDQGELYHEFTRDPDRSRTNP